MKPATAGRAAPEMPVGVLVIVQVPASFRGLSKADVRRKLGHPANAAAMLDSISESIVTYFNKPVDYRQVITALAAHIPANGPENN